MILDFHGLPYIRPTHRLHPEERAIPTEGNEVGGGNHFWHQISCETLFAGLHPRMCQSMLICVTAYVHDSSIAKYAYEKRFDHVK